MVKKLSQLLTEHWEFECLESLFGHEDLHNIQYETNNKGLEVEYDIECIIKRRKIKKNEKRRN